jgi:hypothetical protein
MGLSLHGTACAQDEMIRSFVGPIVLLRDHEVQEELQITRQQKLKLREDLTRVRERYKEEIARVAVMKPGERESFRKTIQAELREVTGQILSCEQMKRLEQIHLQTRGPAVFLESKVQRELRLGKEQKRKIEEIVKGYKRHEKDIADGEAGRHERRTQMQQLQRQTMSTIGALLSEEQQQHWKEMIGEPYE